MGNTQVSQVLMGGVGLGVADPYSVIHADPASYIGLRIPVFETGLVARALQYDMENVSATGGRADLLGLSIGIPIGRGVPLQGAAQPANRWGLALGVNPVSQVGYRISERSNIPGGAGEATFEYTGEGGLNRAFIGLALTLYQTNDTIEKGTRLSIGGNLNYLFGNVEETRKAYFPQALNNYNSSVTTRLVVRSPTANGSIRLSGELISQAQADSILARKRRRVEALNVEREAAWSERGRDIKDFKPKAIPKYPNAPLRYTFSLGVELPASLAAERTELVNSFAIGSTGVEFPYDTTYFREGARGSIELPILYGAGFSIHNNRWTFNLEHRRRDWSRYVVQVDDQEFRSRLTTHAVYAAGASFRPSGDHTGNIYKAGLRYSQDYRIVADHQLQEIGMSFGMAVPVMTNLTRSRINFGVELGERGTTTDGLLRERFANFFVGITITPDVREQWFKKRRLE